MTECKRILCPVDFSEPSNTALEYAESLARTLKAELVVLHVIEPVLYPVAYGLPASSPLLNVEEQARLGAEKHLAPIIEGIGKRGVEARSIVDTGTASLKIVQVAEQLEAGMVVMATHGLTGLKHMLLGSTTERVVRRCPCPVLTVKLGQHTLE
ncbi:MAG: universal stress protein [Planctomycetes bacterium]|nr:universal stress protein [Planctomycetota bacterium]